MSYEKALPTYAELREDEQALDELRSEIQSPEDKAVLDEYQKELAGIALAKEQNSKAVIEKLQQEEIQRREGNDWRIPK